MVDEQMILKLADSHFVLHLLGPAEDDVPHAKSEGAQAAQFEEGEAKKPSNADDECSVAILPENMIQDFLDEASDMIDEVAESYTEWSGWERPLVYGFVDGVLAVADGSWSTLEDSYYEDAHNPDFAAIDEAIERVAQDFEGERPWDEAVKGYVRSAVAHSADDSGKFDSAFWTLCSHGFFYGADSAYDLEWKVVVTPAGNVLLTDEESIEEAALARMEETGGSLMDRVFNMMGIDPDELAAAFAEDDADEAEDVQN